MSAIPRFIIRDTLEVCTQGDHNKVKNRNKLIKNFYHSHGSFSVLFFLYMAAMLLCAELVYAQTDLNKSVPDDDPDWKHFLSLLEIMGICFKHKLTIACIINLKQLVEEHLMPFKIAYPNARKIP